MRDRHACEASAVRIIQRRVADPARQLIVGEHRAIGGNQGESSKDV